MREVPELANRRAQFLAKQALRFEYTAGSDQRDALQLRKDAPDAIMLGEPLVTDGYNIHRVGKEVGPEDPWYDERVRIALRRAVNYEGITDVLASKQDFAMPASRSKPPCLRTRHPTRGSGSTPLRAS